MFHETWKAGSKVRKNEGITFLEHGLAMKVCPRGFRGVAIAWGQRPGRRGNEQARCASRSVRESWQHDSPSWTSTGAQSASSS